MSKFKKIMVYGVVILLTSILLTGCFKQEITCNDETAQSLVHDLTKEQAVDLILVQSVKNGKFRKKDKTQKDTDKADPFAEYMMQSGAMDNLILFMIEAEKNKEGSPLNKKYKELQQKIKTAKFSMTDFLTTKKDKDLNKVECRATTNYKIGSDTYSFDTTYSAQLSDDGKKVYVKMNTFNIK